MWVSQVAGDLGGILDLLASEHKCDFWSLTTTADEVSLVSPIGEHALFTKSEGPWVLFQVEGVLDFGLTGILNSLTKPMADAGISVFAISTYNTDYILIKTDAADAAQAAWQAAGFSAKNL
jgi:hypothetical protein